MDGKSRLKLSKTSLSKDTTEEDTNEDEDDGEHYELGSVMHGKASDDGGEILETMDNTEDSVCNMCHYNDLEVIVFSTPLHNNLCPHQQLAKTRSYILGLRRARSTGGESRHILQTISETETEKEDCNLHTRIQNEFSTHSTKDQRIWRGDED